AASQTVPAIWAIRTTPTIRRLPLCCATARLRRATSSAAWASATIARRPSSNAWSRRALSVRPITRANARFWCLPSGIRNSSDTHAGRGLISAPMPPYLMTDATDSGDQGPMTIFAERPSVFRRAVPAFFALAFGLIASGAAHAASDVVQRIADHFSNVRTMTGEFVQFGPRGEQTGGKFYIERPGKIRFDYEPPARFRVISDGTTVVVENRKMNTADIYPLSKTPLRLLLGERIDLSAANVQSVSEEEDLTTVRLVDRQLGVNSTITMMFDSETYD